MKLLVICLPERQSRHRHSHQTVLGDYRGCCPDATVRGVLAEDFAWQELRQSQLTQPVIRSVKSQPKHRESILYP